METPLSFEYDEMGDILYISKVPLQRRGTP
jgi:hypothetical protein